VPRSGSTAAATSQPGTTVAPPPTTEAQPTTTQSNPPGTLGDAEPSASAPTTASQIPPPSEGQADPTSGPTTIATTDPGFAEDASQVGGLCRSILRPAPRPNIVIEVDVASSRTPTDANLANLKATVERVTGKPVTLNQRVVQVKKQSSWSTDDLDRVEAEVRQAPALSPGRVAVMLLYLDGAFMTDTALAVSYRGASVAVFPDSLSRAGGPLVAASAVEKAVLVHELGHLMCLIDISFRSPRPREDAQHPHHSTNRNSVMFWAIEDISVNNVLAGGPPSTFDSDDEADLADLRAARL
jgi:hypothetical protein